MSRRRRGFGIYYILVAVVLMGLGAAALSGLFSGRQVARTVKRSASEQRRMAAEQYLALGVGLLQRWANKAEGPSVELGGASYQLYQLFREELVKPSGPANAYLDLELGAHVGEDLGALVSERFRLQGGALTVRFRRGDNFAHDAHTGGASVHIQAVIEDQLEDAGRRLPPHLFERAYRYSVTAPSVPAPFDKYVVAIQLPGSLIGTDWNQNVNTWGSSMYGVGEKFGFKLELLRSTRTTLEGLGGIPAVQEALARLVETEGVLEDGRPDTTTVPVVGTTLSSAGKVLVVHPQHVVGQVELQQLDLKGNVAAAWDQIRARAEEAEAAEADLQAGLEAVIPPTFPTDAIPDLARAWVEAQRRHWQALEAGLLVYRDFKQDGVDVVGAGEFSSGGAISHWRRFWASHWRDKAHFQVSGADLEGQLRRLGETVRPLNGIVQVENGPPGGEPLVLRSEEHQLQGRFVLSVSGDVRLEDFQPHQGGEEAERSRALVVTQGDAVVSGRVEAALYCGGTVTFEGAGLLRGALYLKEVGEDAIPAFRDGVLEVLPGPTDAGRFRSRAAGGGYVDSHVLVALDPVTAEAEDRPL